MFVHECQGLYLHLFFLLVIFDGIQFCQLAHPFQYIKRDLLARIHAFEPTPTSIRRLQVEKMSEGGFPLSCCPVQIEKEGQTLFLFRFIVRFQHPGSFLQEDVFQFCILFQVGIERRGISALCFPLADDLLDTRVDGGDVVC